MWCSALGRAVRCSILIICSPETILHLHLPPSDERARTQNNTTELPNAQSQWNTHNNLGWFSTFFFLSGFWIDLYGATCGCRSQVSAHITKRWISDRKVGGASNSRRINAHKRLVSSCAAAVFHYAITVCAQESHTVIILMVLLPHFGPNEINGDVKWLAHACALSRSVLWWTGGMTTLWNYELNSIASERIELSCTLLDIKTNEISWM